MLDDHEQSKGIARRTLFGGAILGAATFATFAELRPQGAAAAATFDEMRTAWVAQLIGAGIDPLDPDYAPTIAELDTSAAESIAEIDRTIGRTSVFTDYLLATDSANVRKTAKRLQIMATAYQVDGTTQYQQPSVLTDIIDGLQTLHDNAYYSGAAEYDNWYDWEIGAAQAINDTVVLLFADVPATLKADLVEAVDYFVPDPRYRTANQPVGPQLQTGANLIDSCRTVIIRGIIAEDGAKVAQGADALPAALGRVTHGDGFYADGGFIQHNHVPYHGGYGLALVKSAVMLLPMLSGTTWEITSPNIADLYDSIEIGFVPLVFGSQMMDIVRGRYVGLYGTSDHLTGHLVIEYMLRLAQGLEGTRAAHWRSICKGWIERDTFDVAIADGRVPLDVLPRIGLIRELMDDSTIVGAAEEVGHRTFGSMDRAVHRRPGWALAVAMSSQRISYYEWGPLGENNHGWFQGSGVTYLYDEQDSGQFADNYWATVNPYRLAGTTVDNRPAAKGDGGPYGAAVPTNAYAGGANRDGYGLAGQRTSGILTDMVASKSWFCLDDCIVALGSGITSSSGYVVETTVSNRNLHDSSTSPVIVDGAAQPETTPWAHTFTSPGWLHDGRHGYVFLDASHSFTLKLAREQRTGYWTDVHDAAEEIDPVTNHFVTSWIDHGSNPVGESYAYALYPGAAPGSMAATAAATDIEIISDTSDLHAMRHAGTGIVMANFFVAGRFDITATMAAAAYAPAAFYFRQVGGAISIAISDPTHLSESVRVNLWKCPIISSAGDPTVTVTTSSLTTSIIVDTSAKDGASHLVQLAT
ncbi:polysaccharide lyase 8 family protein [Ruania alkalisoli]|uniref:Polysaccharide lyase 8 family protein n=1 Tax=Ruania alkalisoli TaxID=2779775 RepID=A0A7M1STC1_9MICO|nr:polysaccharide lyase 8 family protein [Ruania alkalisoli]QOR70816.1 polysaccharide lyase 8 family protein [Ruania alkalisoli]